MQKLFESFLELHNLTPKISYLVFLIADFILQIQVLVLCLSELLHKVIVNFIWSSLRLVEKLLHHGRGIDSRIQESIEDRKELLGPFASKDTETHLTERLTGPAWNIRSIRHYVAKQGPAHNRLLNCALCGFQNLLAKSAVMICERAVEIQERKRFPISCIRHSIGLQLKRKGQGPV